MDLKLLKDERIKKGYTQEYMAEQLGFKSKSSYCLIEKGKISVNTELVNKIAAILGLTNEQMLKIFFAANT